MILPLRVFGNSGVNTMFAGFAIGPIFLPTWLRSSSSISSEPSRAAGRMRWGPLWSATELLGADHVTLTCFARCNRGETSCSARLSRKPASAHPPCAAGILRRQPRVEGE